MFNQKDILARLAAGESIDAIAKEMTAALNAAQAEYKAQEAEKGKLQAGARILQAVLDYMVTYHPEAKITKELQTEGISEDAAREAYTMLDDAVELSTRLENAMPMLGELFAASPSPAKLKRDGVHVIKGEDAIQNFLSKHNL